jgi:hypothetical protein
VGFGSNSFLECSTEEEEKDKTDSRLPIFGFKLNFLRIEEDEG